MVGGSAFNCAVVLDRVVDEITNAYLIEVATNRRTELSAKFVNIQFAKIGLENNVRKFMAEVKQEYNTLDYQVDKTKEDIHTRLCKIIVNFHETHGSKENSYLIKSRGQILSRFSSTTEYSSGGSAHGGDKSVSPVVYNSGLTQEEIESFASLEAGNSFVNSQQYTCFTPAKGFEQEQVTVYTVDEATSLFKQAAYARKVERTKETRHNHDVAVTNLEDSWNARIKEGVDNLQWEHNRRLEREINKFESEQRLALSTLMDEIEDTSPSKLVFSIDDSSCLVKICEDSAETSSVLQKRCFSDAAYNF